MGLEERHTIVDYACHVLRVVIQWEEGKTDAEMAMKAIQALGHKAGEMLPPVVTK